MRPQREVMAPSRDGSGQVLSQLGTVMSQFRRTQRRSIRKVVTVETNYRLNPIDPAVADQMRAAGGDRYIADAKPGYPCRQCLCDAEVGEHLILVSHDPFSTVSPYRSRSPIFLHEEACTAPNDFMMLADQLTRRQLSVRAFDRMEMMIDTAVITLVRRTIHELAPDIKSRCESSDSLLFDR
jgi:hypothetical protein